jgi:hypothetical protein
MKATIRIKIARCFSLFCLIPASAVAYAQWTAPTQEELAMTSQPEVPGAAAVYLYREEVTDDRLHSWRKYVRLKVLTEAGKKYANVELAQYNTAYSYDYFGYSVGAIEGRTIHPDGTIIPFTGKPMEKVVVKNQDFNIKEKVFALPDVEVGSIIEYRYELNYSDRWFVPPQWLVQSELYTRKPHYVWMPTSEQLIHKGEGGDQTTNYVDWVHILPAGFDVKQTKTASISSYAAGQQTTMELDIHDVKPTVTEEYMPPFGSLSYRVLFYYSPYNTPDQYWDAEGKGWSKLQDKFIGPGNKVKQAVSGLVSPGDTADQKLRKLYAAVMMLDNTAYSRGHSANEDTAQGLNEPNSTDDIWERKRGNNDQMAQLFVAMARAAGMKAYVMRVADRDRNVFLRGYLSFSQLDDTIAIVVVDGKVMYFDPGQRYCAYGHLAWKHTLDDGLRQTESGTTISQVPDEPYTASRIVRLADLTMDDHGEATGTVTVTWKGNPALEWRQSYLRGELEGLKHELRTSMERLMPKGMDVKVTAVDNVDDYEQPLVVHYEVNGMIASSTGKRLLVPGDIFEANAKPTFVEEKREEPVLFHYAHATQDVVRVTYPASMAVESAPVDERVPLEKLAVYVLKTESTPTSITVRRELDLGTALFKLDEYPSLRTFYNKFESKDQEPVVLKLAAAAAGGN